MDRSVRASVWRGGTSRGVLLRADDLQLFSEEQIEGIILAALGSPDPDGRQIDGLGGGISSMSKAAVVGWQQSPDDVENIDVTYRFAQVEVTEPKVNFTGNCGNMAAAIAPFAVEEGFIRGMRQSVAASVLNLNTGQRFRTRVPIHLGRYKPEGDFAIAGVPGTGSRLTLEYLDPDGSIGRGALPTGVVREDIDVPGCGTVPVTIIDVGNPAVFVSAASLGVSDAAVAAPAELDAEAGLQERLEHIRCEAAVRAGVASSVAKAAQHERTVPKVALVAPPAAYRTTSGEDMGAGDIDLLVRLISMGRTHRSLAVTGAMACSAAAVMDGSVPHEVAGWSRARRPSRRTVGGRAGSPGAGPTTVSGEVRLGHPAGVLTMDVKAELAEGAWRVPTMRMDRTAREIIRGMLRVPYSYLNGTAWFMPNPPP